jgi:DNA topoisomerase-2
VNSIATSRGGKHVDLVSDLVCDKLIEMVRRKNKQLKDTKPAEIKKHLFLFLSCKVFNPTFDSQTKTCCTSTRADLALTVDPETRAERREKLALSEAFVKQMNKSGLVAMLAERVSERGALLLAKTDGRKGGSGAAGAHKRLTGIPKLEDANDAGTARGHLCTLILTEGDSAKALAVSGLGIVGRDRFGVFPLKGKLLNVREASHKQVVENAEVTAIKQILGLRAGVNYVDTKELRYGHVMIMSAAAP